MLSWILCQLSLWVWVSPIGKSKCGNASLSNGCKGIGQQESRFITLTQVHNTLFVYVIPLLVVILTFPFDHKVQNYSLRFWYREAQVIFSFCRIDWLGWVTGIHITMLGDVHTASRFWSSLTFLISSGTEEGSTRRCVSSSWRMRQTTCLLSSR